MKAVKITTNNQEALANQFNHPERPIEPADYADMLPIGYWLVTDFGSEIDYDLLNDGSFNDLYTRGRSLRNNYIEVIPNA